MAIETEGDSAGGEVTYVGGRAVEQTTEGETHEGTDHGDELAAAKEAVKKALAEEGKKAAKEAKDHLDKDLVYKAARAADGKFKSDQDPAERELEEAKEKLHEELAPPKKEPRDDDASALRKALADRKEAAKYKAEAAAEVQKAREEARQMYQELARERQEIAAERERLALLRKDPIRAIRDNGWDPEEFILDIANDGTPEGQAKRRERELLDRLDRAERWQKEQETARQQEAERAAKAEKAQLRRNTEQQFLNTAAARKPDGTHKNAHLVSMYRDDPQGLIERADRVADRYREATGAEATFAEIVEYLEEYEAKRYKVGSGSAPQVGAPVTQGRPAQGSATGKRSLSPNGSSERRSLGPSIGDLDGDERRSAAMDAVRAALHASGER